MEKASKAFDSIKSKALNLIDKYQLNEEPTQVKLAFAVISGITALVILKKVISKPGSSDNDPADSHRDKSKESSKKKNQMKKGSTKFSRGLTLTENNFRRAVISDLDYGLVFFLDPEADATSYEAMATLHFRLNKAKVEKEGPLFIDYEGKSIFKIRINGSPVKNIDKYWKEAKLELPVEFLKDGPNHIEIYFSNTYSTNNLEGGLVMVKDNNDKYVYTVTKPFHSQKIYPCFDQQNLKSTVKLLLVTPDQWKVASNDSAANIDDISSAFSSDMTADLKQTLERMQSNWRLWAFNLNDRIPVNALGFMAGPFESITLSEKVHASPKFSIFAKRSIAKDLKRESEDLFLLLIDALEYLEGFFGKDYPFRKCDLVFLPCKPEQEMGLAGCCVLSEEYLFASEDDLLTRISKTVGVIQQLALAWFGHYVTPSWCGDNWLDQGFTLFLAHYCLVKVCRSPDCKIKRAKELSEKNIWSHFSIMKELSLLGTNLQIYYPIAPNFQNTQEYEALDYSVNRWRAAAVWKQLLFLVGDDNLKRGIKKCISEYGNRFIDTMSFAETFEQAQKVNNNETPMGNSTDNFVMANTFNISNFDFKQWMQDWIYSKGISHLEFSWEKNNSMFNNLVRVMHSSVSDGNSGLRTHRLKIAFLDEWGQISKIKEVLIENQEQTNLMLESGQKLPNALVLDSEGNSLFSSKIDPDSLQFFLKNLSRVTDELALSTIVQRCIHIVMKGNLSSKDYIHMVAKFLNERGAETSLLLFQQIILFAHLAIEKFAPSEYHVELKTEMYNACYNLIRDYSQIGQIALNEIWRFIIRGDQVKNTVTILRRQLTGFEYNYLKLPLKNIYLILKACYLVDRNKNHYENFVQFVQASETKDSAAQDLVDCFGLAISPDFEEELSSLGDLQYHSKELSSFEGIKTALKLPSGPTVLENMLSRFEIKGDEWSNHSALEYLETVWELANTAKLQVNILGGLAKMNMKNKQNLVKLWIKLKTEEIKNRKAAYDLIN